MPKALVEIFQSAENAFAVRLSPRVPDLATRFNRPVFRIKRDYETSDNPLTEGLGYRLRTTFKPTADDFITKNRQSPKEKAINAVLSQVDPNLMKGDNLEDKLTMLKGIIQVELQKINPDLSVFQDQTGLPLDLGYMENIMGMDDECSIKDWVDGVITAAVSEDFWELIQPTDETSVFYEGPKQIDIANVGEAEKLSIKVQFLLSEANFYARTNQLSSANFGELFDEEPHATNIAQQVKDGLNNGENIEKIIFDYINKYHTELGLNEPLTEEQQTEIADKFTQHYNVIKDSPHFDEFFLADTDKKGNIFTHQNKISCHFLDFFARKTKGDYSLGELAGHTEALMQRESNRLNHKNEIVAKGYERIDQFKQDVVGFLKENKSKELVDHLLADSPDGIPNYTMLSLETQNYISYNRNWPAIEQELNNPERNIPANEKQDMLRLLARDNVKHENISAITWSKYSSLPLLEVELGRVAEGLKNTVLAYNQKRDRQWFKGKRNESREAQCEAITKVANDINNLLERNTLSKREVLDNLLKAIETLDKIDQEISQEGGGGSKCAAN